MPRIGRKTFEPGTHVWVAGEDVPGIVVKDRGWDRSSDQGVDVRLVRDDERPQFGDPVVYCSHGQLMLERPAAPQKEWD